VSYVSLRQRFRLNELVYIAIVARCVSICVDSRIVKGICFYSVCVKPLMSQFKPVDRMYISLYAFFELSLQYLHVPSRFTFAICIELENKLFVSALHNLCPGYASRMILEIRSSVFRFLSGNNVLLSMRHFAIMVYILCLISWRLPNVSFKYTVFLSIFL
jgi:hypothetical protein